MSAAVEFLNFIALCSQKPLRQLHGNELKQKYTQFQIVWKQGDVGGNITFSRIEVKPTKKTKEYILQDIADEEYETIDYYLDSLDFTRIIAVAFSYFLNHGKKFSDNSDLSELEKSYQLVLQFSQDPNGISNFLPSAMDTEGRRITRTLDKLQEDMKTQTEFLMINTEENTNSSQLYFISKEDDEDDQLSENQKYIFDRDDVSQNADIAKTLNFMHSFLTTLFIPPDAKTGAFDHVLAKSRDIYKLLITAVDANVARRLRYLNISAGLRILQEKDNPNEEDKENHEKLIQKLKALTLASSTVLSTIQVEDKLKTITPTPSKGSAGRDSYQPVASSGPGLARHRPLVVGEYCECSSSDDDDDYGSGYGRAARPPPPSGLYREHYAAAARPRAARPPPSGLYSQERRARAAAEAAARHRPLVVSEYCECSSSDDDYGEHYAASAAPPRPQPRAPQPPPDFEREARAWRRQEPAAQPPSGFYDQQPSVSVRSGSESETEEQLDTLAAHVAAGGRPTQYCECCPSDPLQHGTYFVCDTYPDLAVAVQVAPHADDSSQSVLRLARCQGALAHGVPPVESILSRASSPVEVAFERKVQSLLRDQGAAGVLAGTCQLVFPSDQPPVVWQMHCFSRAVRDAWQGRKEAGPRRQHVARLAALHDPRSNKAFVALVDTRGGGKGGRKYMLQQGLSSHRDVAAAAAHFEARRRGAKGSHAAYALLDDHYRCLQPGAADAHKARLACVRAADDDGGRDLSVQECVDHFAGEPLLCANYQMLYAGLREHADKYGERASHYVKSLSRSKSQKPVYWDALALFVEDMQHH